MKKFLILFIIVMILLGGAYIALTLDGGSPSGKTAAASAQTAGEDKPSGDAVVEADAKAGDEILLVNADNPLPKDYEPEELVTLFEFKDRSFELARSDIQLERIAYEAAQKMFAAAKEDGVDTFIITSGYRSRDRQQELYAESTDATVAKPGTSEHESGLAFDLSTMNSGDSFDTTKQFAWLSQHCWEYGFILRYPKGKESVTGIPYEPWHYRYVGLEAAKTIYDKGITLEEYLK
jgi:D-alanyl-D-alanine carboxypeptidase